MTSDQDAAEAAAERSSSDGPATGRFGRRSTLVASLAGAGLLLVGAGAGAAVTGMLHRDGPRFDADLPTTPIVKLVDGARSELKGEVVEIFGNKFVLDDGTGRALVETGRAGEGGKLVAAKETVTVQGRFENGFVHGEALQRADGSVDELRPAPPPHPRGPRP